MINRIMKFLTSQTGTIKQERSSLVNCAKLLDHSYYWQISALKVLVKCKQKQGQECLA